MRGRRGRAAFAGVAVLLALSACTSNTTAGRPVETVTETAGGSSSGTPAPGGSSTTAAAAAVTLVNSAKGHRISPTDTVTISVDGATLQSVAMRNPAGREVAGELAADGRSWHNTEVLGYDRTYKVTAVAQDADGHTVTKKSRVVTLKPDNMTMPYLNTVYGNSIEDGGTYGVGMVVNLHFDEPITDKAAAEKALEVTTTPAVQGAWYWLDDTNAHWRPERYYAPGTKVSVKANVYGKDLGNGLYGQADQHVSFTIGQKRVSIANAKTHQVKVFFDNKLVRKMPTSMGMGGCTTGKQGQQICFWTMPGTYTVLGHENPATMSSDSYGLSKDSPYGYAAEKVPFATKISTDGIYLHELDTTVWAQGNTNVSHGCLNLNYDNAKWYFNHSHVGDIVRVVKSGGAPLEVWQGGDWDVPWAKWVKGGAAA